MIEKIFFFDSLVREVRSVIVNGFRDFSAVFLVRFGGRGQPPVTLHGRLWPLQLNAMI